MIVDHEKRQVAMWLGGKLEFPIFMSDDEINNAIKELLEEIHGDFYEYTKKGRQQAASSIKRARKVMRFRKEFNRTAKNQELSPDLALKRSP